MYFPHYFCKAAILISVFYYFRWFTIIYHIAIQDTYTTHNFPNLKTKKYISKLNKLFVCNFFINVFNNRANHNINMSDILEMKNKEA